jgi:hypothetical protein
VDSAATQKIPASNVEIETHGNLLAFAKAVAKNWGWTARTEDEDIDPIESRAKGYTVRSPGEGALVLSCGEEEVVLDYWLPEDGRVLAQEIENVVRGQRMSADRRRGRRGAIVLR